MENLEKLKIKAKTGIQNGRLNYGNCFHPSIPRLLSIPNTPKSQVNHRDTKTQRKPDLELGENKRMDKNITLKNGFLCASVSLWLKNGNLMERRKENDESEV